MKSAAIGWPAFFALMLPMLVSCQETPATGSHPANPNKGAYSDPCAVRLQDIGGALLEYYLLNQTLPQDLNDLKSMASVDTPLDFTCPESHKPYLYFPQGLAGPSMDKLILVCDSEPTHNGSRFCLLMSPLHRGRAAQTDVLLIPEANFQQFHPQQ